MRSPLCGANCLFALQILVGDSRRGIADIMRECKFDWKKGINLLNIKRYLEHRKYKVTASRISHRDIADSQYYIIPVRVAGSVSYNHFYLILRKEENRIIYFDGNNKVDVLFSDQDLQISLDEVIGIPFVWGTEVQVRRWRD